MKAPTREVLINTLDELVANGDHARTGHYIACWWPTIRLLLKEKSDVGHELLVQVQGRRIYVKNEEHRGTLLWSIAQWMLHDQNACLEHARRLYQLTDPEVAAILSMSD